MIVVKLDDDQTTIRSGNVEIDLKKHVVSIKGKNIILTEEEYDIAVLMARWGLL
jgi:DNA-binding response OmpR family regulator